MLTEQQLMRLEPLIKHKKYGALLKSAIVGWKRCKPIAGLFGVILTENKFVRDTNINGCCLIGAAILNKTSKTQYRIEGAQKIFDLTANEIWSLSDGYESDESWKIIKEAWKFGNKVRNIINPSKYVNRKSTKSA